VSWNDGKIMISQFRSLGTRVNDRAAAVMSRLMYGLHPDLDLKKIKDRMSNHESGYSFVKILATICVLNTSSYPHEQHVWT
jgi:hypothetical protein